MLKPKYPTVYWVALMVAGNPAWDDFLAELDLMAVSYTKIDSTDVRIFDPDVITEGIEIHHIIEQHIAAVAYERLGLEGHVQSAYV